MTEYIGLRKNGNFAKQHNDENIIKLSPDEYIRTRGSFEIEEILQNYENWIIREKLGKELPDPE